MKLKRLVAMLMILCMALGIILAFPVTANAATGDVDYVTSGQYVYNWGTRGETATFLSPMAESFYENNDVAYQELSTLAGSSTTGSVPSSELYQALHGLMAENHTTMTSYGDVRYLSCYTDCEENDKSKIVLFYKGTLISSTWDYGKTWQREHTWPNSKSTSGSNDIANTQVSRETDIIMLRPADPGNNMSRSNTPYGESSGYFHPNKFAVSGHDVCGDVARTILYVYVRWGGDSTYHDGALGYMWGSSGVIESKDVLLKWMEEDPVDTWEMGRNDSAESITGTRNIFVDYPELAFALFDEEVPAGMITPSGSVGNCDHTETYVNQGDTHSVVCGLCHVTLQANIAHIYENGQCVCGKIPSVEDTEVLIENPVPGTAYRFGMVQGNVSQTDIYYLDGGMSKTYYFATSTDRDAAIDVYLEETSGGYYLYTLKDGAKTYVNMVQSGSYVNAAYGSTAATVYTYDQTANTVVANVGGSSYRFGTRSNQTYTNVGPVKTSYDSFYCQFYGQLLHDCNTAGHIYENGVCSVCGTKEFEKFTINLMNMSLQNTLQANFALEKTWYGDWDGCYAVITQEGKAPVTVTIDQWAEVKIPGEGDEKISAYAVPYTGIAAKEMTDEISIVVYNAAGEAISEPYTSSVKAYALRAFSTTTREDAKTMYIDMLYYGAAAQQDLNYKEDDLATDGLTVDQTKYKSAAPDLSNRQDPEGDAIVSRAILESNIQLQVAFDSKYLEGGYTAKYSYTDHTGKAVEREAELTRATNGSTVYAGVIVDALVVADCGIDVTVTIYDASEKAVATAKDSVGRWATRTAGQKDLAAAIVNFSNSAYEFLH